MWGERSSISEYYCEEIVPDFRLIWGPHHFQNKLLRFSVHNLHTLQADRDQLFTTEPKMPQALVSAYIH